MCRNGLSFIELRLFEEETAMTSFGVSGTGSTVWAGYWHEFVDFWTNFLTRQDGVVMTVLAAGALALFIITRVKGNKG